MNSKILNRSMFLDKTRPDIDNIGIMQGFMDDVADREETPDDLQAHETNEELDEMHMADRRPGAPEILMNNLRGDMRSVNARYDELANLVGPAVARDTPEEVLALLQPVLAGGQGGIGELPGAQPMLSGAPPPPPPPGGQGGGGLPPSLSPSVPPPGVGPVAAQGVGSLFPSAPNAGVTPVQGPTPMAHGGMVGEVANMGRAGDTQLAYLSPGAQRWLSATGGSGTVNPATGLREFALGAGLRGLSSAFGKIPKMFGKADDAIPPSPAVGPAQDMSKTLRYGANAPPPPQTAVQSIITKPISSAAAVGTAGFGGVGTGLLLNQAMNPPVEEGSERPPPPVVPGGAVPGAVVPGGAVPGGAVPTAAELVQRANEGETLTPEELAFVYATYGIAGPQSADPGAVVPRDTPKDMTQSFLERVNSRYGDLRAAIRSPQDDDDRKAQALFLIADAGLKLTSGKGRTPVEDITLAASGLPAGFAALGAQKSAGDLKLRTAATEQVLGEIAAEKKAENALAVATARARQSAAEKDRPLQELLVSVRAAYRDMDPKQQMILAMGLLNKTIVPGLDPDKNPALVNILTPGQFWTSPGASNLVPDKNTLGFVPLNHPLVIPTPALSAAAPEDRENIRKENARLGGLVKELRDVYGGVFSQAFGPREFIRSMVGGASLAFFGPAGPWASVETEDKSNAIRALGKTIQKLESASPGRVSVQEQNEIQGWIDKPQNFWTDSTKAFALIRRLETNAVNEISGNFNRLYPNQYAPRQLDSNASIGLSKDTALSMNDPQTLVLLDMLSREAPEGYRPFIRDKPGAAARQITLPLKEFMNQPDIQKRLGRGAR